MSLISFTPVSDGSTASASGVNTPLTTIYNDYNGNITDANVASSAAIATSKLALSASWSSFTPTLANITLGNGTSTGSYIQIGKTVLFNWTLTLGSTSSMGTGPTFTLPAAPSGMTAGISGGIFGHAYDSSAGTIYPVSAVYVSGSTMRVIPYNAGLSYVVGDTVTSSQPFTWATGDILEIAGTYQAT